MYFVLCLILTPLVMLDVINSLNSSNSSSLKVFFKKKTFTFQSLSHPHSTTDVEEMITKTFPHPIDRLIIDDAEAAAIKGIHKLAEIIF